MQDALKNVGTIVEKLLIEARSLSEDVQEVETFLCQQLCFNKQSTPISWDNIEDALRPSDAVKVKVSAPSDLNLPRLFTLLDLINT